MNFGGVNGHGSPMSIDQTVIQMLIQIARLDAELRGCFPAFLELRPHLREETFMSQVRRQRREHGYTVAYIRTQDEVVAAAGYRLAEFLAWGKVLYVDDLVTVSAARNQGYGSALLDWLLEQAGTLGCEQLHLDSGVHRHAAHRLYMSRRLVINSYHFAVESKPVSEPGE